MSFTAFVQATGATTLVQCLSTMGSLFKAKGSSSMISRIVPSTLLKVITRAHFLSTSRITRRIHRCRSRIGGGINLKTKKQRLINMNEILNNDIAGSKSKDDRLKSFIERIERLEEEKSKFRCKKVIEVLSFVMSSKITAKPPYCVHFKFPRHKCGTASDII